MNSREIIPFLYLLWPQDSGLSGNILFTQMKIHEDILRSDWSDGHLLMFIVWCQGRDPQFIAFVFIQFLWWQQQGSTKRLCYVFRKASFEWSDWLDMTGASWIASFHLELRKDDPRGSTCMYYYLPKTLLCFICHWLIWVNRGIFHVSLTCTEMYWPSQLAPTNL